MSDVQPACAPGVTSAPDSSSVESGARPRARSAPSQLLWILAAGAVGFASAFTFADRLRLPRAVFLVPHVAVTAAFVGAYARWSATDLRRLWSRRVGAGVIAAGVVGALLVANVLGQPASPRPAGVGLWFDVFWLGIVYGAVDGLLLSVLPVVAAWRASAALGWTERPWGRVGAAALALAASVLVTAAYHLGYEEFRGPAVARAVTGNALMSAAQLVSSSPVASVGSHVVMHVAAVLHGPDTTVQLPPHETFRTGE